MQNTTARHFCFTSYANEPPAFDDAKMRYLIYQLEVCPSTGKSHYQCYVELNTAMRPTTFKALIGGQPHVEYRKGSRDQARSYCMKEDSRIEPYVEHGTWNTSQGKRNDLEEIYSQIASGISDATILESHPGQYIRYARGIREARFTFNTRDLSKKRRTELKCVVYWGPTGTGKTRRAFDKGGDSLFCLTKGNSSNVWFDGYTGEQTLLLDDFYGWISYGYLLQLLDIYPIRLEVKGGHTWAAWTRIIITSNKAPTEWYQRIDISALERRITKVKCIEKPKEQEEEESKE